MKKDRDEIKGDLYDAFAGGGITNFNVGGVARTSADAIGEAIGEIYDYGDLVIANGMAATAEGEYLDVKVMERGLVRQEAVKTKGLVKFNRAGNSTGDISIPAGTLVSTKKDKNGISYRFQVTEPSFIPDVESYAVIMVEAISAGQAHNVGPYTINKIVTPIEGVSGVSNPIQPIIENWMTVPGSDEESDERLRERYFLAWSEKVTGATVQTYKYWALSSSGSVGYAVIDTTFRRGPGTVDVIIIGPGGESFAGDPDFIKSVQDFIDERKPAGEDVLVKSPLPKIVDLDFTVVRYPGFRPDALEADISSMLAAYFHPEGSADYPWIKPLGVGRKISYSTLIQICTRPEGVYEVIFDEIAGHKPKDIHLNDNEIPQLGSVNYGHKEISF